MRNLVILNPQFEKIKAIYKMDFISRVYDELVEIHGANLGLDNKELSFEILDDLVDEAKEFDFETEGDVFYYITKFYEYDFLQERPLEDKVVEILTWPDRDSYTKFELLEEYKAENGPEES